VIENCFFQYVNTYCNISTCKDSFVPSKMRESDGDDCIIVFLKNFNLQLEGKGKETSTSKGYHSFKHEAKSVVTISFVVSLVASVYKLTRRGTASWRNWLRKRQNQRVFRSVLFTLTIVNLLQVYSYVMDTMWKLGVHIPVGII
jgi:hypothetical protein